MKTESYLWALRLPLALLCFCYAFLGWYLAAHHAIWLVVALVVLVSAAIAMQEKPWREDLGWDYPPVLTIAALIAAIAFLYLLVSPSVLPSLIAIPLLASSLADVEMRSLGLGQRHRLLIFIFLAALGLVAGEIIDLMLFPSTRF